MPEVRGFRGYRFDHTRVGPLDRVITPPFDVIDPDMRDELRVTVVATGLGNSAKQGGTEKPSLVQVNRTPTGAEDLDQPTILRNRKKAAQRAQATGGNSAEDMAYLDIPAFLRRQAD